MLMKKISLFFFFVFLFLPHISHAALESRFEVINFKPAVDGGEYITVYGAQNLRAWQGNVGMHYDFSKDPLQFKGFGDVTGNDNVISGLHVLNIFMALGINDWFEVGVDIPIVLLNDFTTDDFLALPDSGGGMGDIFLMTKFRVINPDKSGFGFALMPFMTLPSGDVERYTGNGAVTGGLMAIVDGSFNERFHIALNAGVEVRDNVIRNNVQVDDRLLYGLGMNYKVSPNFHVIAEAFGKTNLFNSINRSGESPLEAGGGLRYLLGDSGVSLDLGGSMGLINGIGSPQYRVNAGVKWVSAGVKDCPECPPPAPPPDPRIQGDQIVIWGKIFFDTDSTEIKTMSNQILDEVAEVMTSNPFLDLVEIQGHTDIRGGAKYNRELSQKRAEEVKTYLTSKGVESSRLMAKGYGSDVPLASNDTKEGMSQNRRVEFHIVRRSDFY